MTEQKMKLILDINEWNELDKPEQFLTLMSNFHELAPGVRARVVAKIPNLKELAEKFKQYCAYGIVDYEPSIMMVLSKQIDDIAVAMGNSNTIRGPEKREKISFLYNAFSEWFGLYSEVRCTSGKDDFVCNVAEAIEIAIENDESDNCEKLDMMLLTRERMNLMERQEAKIMGDFGVDMDILSELLGDDESLELLETKVKKYLN